MQMNLPKLLKLNLQHFAENEDTSTEETDTTENTNDENEQKETTFSQADVDREISKAVNKALENRDAKHQQELDNAIKNALEEEKRLSKLSEKEREAEELTQKEKELAEREAEINRRILHSDAVDALQERGLPSDFADFLVKEDGETTLENINTFKKAFDEAINAGVKEQLRQDTPKAGSAPSKGNVPSVADLAQEHRLIK